MMYKNRRTRGVYGNRFCINDYLVIHLKLFAISFIIINIFTLIQIKLIGIDFQPQYLLIPNIVSLVIGYILAKLNISQISLEKTLTEKEQIKTRLENIVTVSADWIWEVDAQGHYTYVLGRIKEFLGYEAEEIIGKSPFDLMDKKEAQRVGEIFTDIVQHKKSIENLVNWNITKSGHKVCLLTNGLPIFDQEGNLHGYRGVNQDITDRKDMEYKLQYEKQLFHTFMDNIPDRIYFKDLESRFLRNNMAHLDSFGLKSQEEALGKTDFDFFTEEHARQAFEDEQHVIKSSKPITIEEKETWPDGRITWVLSAKMPWRDEHGNTIGTFGFSRDITERKQAEQKLRESEEKFRLVFEHSPVSFWEEDYTKFTTYLDELRNQGIEDIDTYLTNNPHFIEKCVSSIKIIGINQATVDLHKAKNKEELLYRQIDTLTPESYQTLKQVLIDTWNNKTESVYETIVQTLDGEKRNVILNFSLLPAKNGQSKVIVSVVDITQRKQFEQEIVKSEYRKTILNRIANVFLTTPDERMYENVLSIIIEITKSRYGKFGYIDENSNLVIPSLIFGVWEECRVEDKSIIFPSSTWGDSLWGKAIVKRKTYISNGPFHMPKGHVPIVNYLVVPIVYRKKTIGLIAAANKETDYSSDDKEILEEIARFISPILEARLHRDKLEKIRKQAEKELTRLNETLLRSNRELEDFAYIASHDLQEPLRKVRAFGDRLKIKYKNIIDEIGKDYLNRMDNASKRMQILIDDLLVYSRVSTKKKPFKPVELKAVIDGVLSDLEIMINETKAKVICSDLPCIDADNLQMRQLFQNLIGNALKFRNEDTAPVIKISAVQKQDGFTKIIVKDNGIGFDNKYCEKIFVPFQRLHGLDEYKGSGIGLAICKKIIERHGGKISAKSTPGNGAKFIIQLPVKN